MLSDNLPYWFIVSIKIPYSEITSLEDKQLMLVTRNKGYTLLELMITLVMAAILLGIGVPSLTDFIKNNRMLAVTNGLMTVIKTARSEAMTQRANVTVCRSSDNVNCDGFGNNYIAFTDAGTANVVDGTDIFVSRTTINADNLVVFYSGGSSIRFDSRGRALGSSGTITVCEPTKWLYPTRSAYRFRYPLSWITRYC